MCHGITIVFYFEVLCKCCGKLHLYNIDIYYLVAPQYFVRASFEIGFQ